MSELLYFPAAKGRHRREPLTFKRKFLRAVTAGTFVISASVGLGAGADLIWGKHPDQELVSSEHPTGNITKEQVHGAAHAAIRETISGTSELVYSLAGLTGALGIGVVSAAAASRRKEHETVPSVRFAEDIVITPELEVEQVSTPEPACTQEPEFQPVAYPTTAELSFDQLDWELRNPGQPIYC
jgi:hypothetical protein